MSDAIEKRLTELRTIASAYASAFADRQYLEEYKKSHLAILMKDYEPKHKTSAAQEREALADPRYLGTLKGLKAATELSEKLRWELRIAETGAELWRTQQSTMRAERKGYGA